MNPTPLSHKNSSQRAWWSLRDFRDKAKQDRGKEKCEPMGIRIEKENRP